MLRPWSGESQQRQRKSAICILAAVSLLISERAPLWISSAMRPTSALSSLSASCCWSCSRPAAPRPRRRMSCRRPSSAAAVGSCAALVRTSACTAATWYRVSVRCVLKAAMSSRCRRMAAASKAPSRPASANFLAASHASSRHRRSATSSARPAASARAASTAWHATMAASNDAACRAASAPTGPKGPWTQTSTALRARETQASPKSASSAAASASSAASPTARASA
mmetsp:Transcript_2512/g.9158  ORF Transcript_2512/g.9158 Transcript_2512/m.9158 type:complete len:227 (-) Transcript_2512:370-1050(-)